MSATARPAIVRKPAGISHLIDAESERLILANLLGRPEICDTWLPMLSIDLFALERHKRIFQLISDSVERGNGGGLDGAYRVLLDLKKSPQELGLGVLSELAYDNSVDLINPDPWIASLRRKHAERRAWRSAECLRVSIESGTATAEDLESTREDLLEIQVKMTSGTAETMFGPESVKPMLDYSNTKISHVLEGILVEGTITVISGESGCGKSSVVSAIAAAVAHGQSFAGRMTSRRNVLYADRENPLSVTADRFARLGIRDGAGFRFWGSWCPEEPPGPTSPALLSWVEKCAPQPLLVFDSLISFYPGQSENDSVEMRKYLDGYRRLAARGCTILTLHNSGKGESSQLYRGSSDIKAGIDTGWHLANFDEHKLGRLRLKAWKMRHGVAEEISLNYLDGAFLSSAETPMQTVTARLVSLLKDNPGIEATAFETLSKERTLGRDRARTFLVDGIKAGTIERRNGDGNRKTHYWIGNPSEVVD